LAGLRRYCLSDSPLRPRLEEIFRTLPQRTVSLVGQAPLGGSQVAEWDFESPESWRWHAGIIADDLTQDSEGQMRQIFEKYERLLAAEFMTVADHCLRTWIFVRDIDHNYAGVVRGRKDYFETIGLTPETHFIASTGIAGTHANPQVLVMMDALAIPDVDPASLRYLKGGSHLSPTADYGVTFERGTSFSYEGLRYTLISGTASIDNRGQVLYPESVEKQTLRMLENIRVLLAEDGADFRQVPTALVYLRNPEDAPAVRMILDRELPCLDYLLLHAPVCRPTWLVEMECVAVRPCSPQVP
jgi:enamine deaminase RidA (YjgF/YER057c/UK114 family)